MLHAVLPLPVPASVYGLVLLLAALTAGVVKLEQVKETGTYLTGIFPLLFVPAAAGIMELWAEMGQLLLPILIAILPVTVLVMAAAGRTTQALTARNKKEEADHDLAAERLSDRLCGMGRAAYAGSLWAGCAHQPGDRQGHL